MALWTHIAPSPNICRHCLLVCSLLFYALYLCACWHNIGFYLEDFYVYYHNVWIILKEICNKSVVDKNILWNLSLVLKHYKVSNDFFQLVELNIHNANKGYMVIGWYKIVDLQLHINLPVLQDIYKEINYKPPMKNGIEINHPLSFPNFEV